MERRIVNVGQGDGGWLIEQPLQDPITIPDLQRAILTACQIARAEHEASGAPTAVRIRKICGDGVMMGFCG